jgi:hypothetical protein
MTRPVATTSPARAVICVLVLCALAAVLAPCKPRAPEIGDLTVTYPLPLAWRNLAPGLDSTRLTFTRKSDSTRVEIAAFRVDPARYRFGMLFAPALVNQPAANLADLTRQAGPVLAVNTNFYLPETFKPIGLIVSAGATLNPWKPGAGSGVFFVKDGKADIEWAKELHDAWAASEAAVQAGPLIVEPGGIAGIRADTRKYHPRTAVALDPSRRVIILATIRQDENNVELSGLDLYELMQILQLDPNHGGLDLSSALNLDGGVSTSLELNLGPEQFHIPSIHPIPAALAVYPR